MAKKKLCSTEYLISTVLFDCVTLIFAAHSVAVAVVVVPASLHFPKVEGQGCQKLSCCCHRLHAEKSDLPIALSG